MNNSDYLKQLFLKYPNEFRKAVISDHQIKVIKQVGTVASSRDIAVHLNMSIYSASLQLRKLWDMGYLDRIEVNSISGGKEYIYSSKFRDILK